jgi:hypothetical protein
MRDETSAVLFLVTVSHFGIFSGPCERGNPDLAHGFEFAPISANGWILVIEAVIRSVQVNFTLLGTYVECPRLDRARMHPQRCSLHDPQFALRHGQRR